ncbi:uncharacterized protein [Amphiura filiformis]|uniref:uncharacterized protein n=1 Tax=Amphiura filiformis TaxID=82378 RepID=UPI003B213046
MDKSWNWIYFTLWILLHYTVQSSAQCTTDNECNSVDNRAMCNNDLCVCSLDYFGSTCSSMKALVGFEETNYSFRENEGQGPDDEVSVYITREGNINMRTDTKITAMASAGRAQEAQAIEGNDYTFNPNPMTEEFNDARDGPMGTTRRKVDFQLINDNDQEGDEYFELVLSIAPEHAEQSRVLADKRVAIIKIKGGDGVQGCNAMTNSPSFTGECSNGGTCHVNGTCLCTPGYSGLTCELGPCNPNPCLNDGVCSSSGSTFTCACTTGHIGATCTVNPCNSGPCMNNGSCFISETGTDFICDCTGTGFEGSTCAVASSTNNGGGGDSNNQSGGPGGLSSTTIIIIVVVAAVFIVIIIIVVLVFFLKRRSDKKKSQSRGPGERRDNTYAERVVYRNERSQARNGNERSQPRNGNERSQPRSGNNTPNQKRQKEPTGQQKQRHTGQRGPKQTGQKGHLRQRQGTVYDKAERKIGAEFPRQKLKLHEHLGSGAFANVVRADAMGILRRRVNTIVAVKMLKEMATESDRSDFLKELKVFRMLEPHPNIIVMLGCCTDKEPYYLIMEYAPHGSLQSHLRGIRNAPESPYSNVEGQRREFLTPSEILQFGSQIANGMKYLSSKQCIHRDLATRNILLGDGLVCKLSDFGLARDISEQNSYEMQSRGRVPIRWMAIESLLENSYTSKSDVWSFGVTMWELVTLGSHPYPGMSSKRVLQELQKGYRLAKPEHCSQDIYSMMKECWQERPEKRPGFGQIHRKLDQMLEDAQGYLAMTDFDASGYVYLDPDANSDSSFDNDEH